MFHFWRGRMSDLWSWPFDLSDSRWPNDVTPASQLAADAATVAAPLTQNLKRNSNPSLTRSPSNYPSVGLTLRSLPMTIQSSDALIVRYQSTIELLSAASVRFNAGRLHPPQSKQFQRISRRISKNLQQFQKISKNILQESPRICRNYEKSQRNLEKLLESLRISKNPRVLNSTEWKWMAKRISNDGKCWQRMCQKIPSESSDDAAANEFDASVGLNDGLVNTTNTESCYGNRFICQWVWQRRLHPFSLSLSLSLPFLLA